MISRNSVAFLIGSILMCTLATFAGVKHKNNLFGNGITASDVIYDRCDFYQHVSGSGKVATDRFEFKNKQGALISVSPGAWAYGLYQNKPQIDLNKEFEVGYINAPDQRVVFLRQEAVIFLTLADGLDIANRIYDFEKWFFFVYLAGAMLLIYCFILSIQKK